MKQFRTETLLILLLCLVLGQCLSAQDTVIIYFSKEGLRTPDKKKAFFYRKGFYSSGTWKGTDYFMNGIVSMTGSYTAEDFKNKQGNFVRYYENGKKKSEGGYFNNMEEGIWIGWYESGKKNWEGKMAKNKKEGLWVYWHENGVKRTEGKFENDNSEGDWTSWYENGQVNVVGRYYNYMRMGTWKFYSESGELNFEESYEHGKLFTSTWYYQNGHKRSKCYFSNEKRHGEFMCWNVDEEIILKGSYLNGAENGEWIRYFRNGESMRIQYDNGVAQGKQLGGIIKKSE